MKPINLGKRELCSFKNNKDVVNHSEAHAAVTITVQIINEPRLSKYAMISTSELLHETASQKKPQPEHIS